MKEDKDALAQIRAVAEKIARENNKTVEEVTNKEVKDGGVPGNDGYVGAHLQVVKIEHARAKRLDEKDVSAQFKAALYDEINRFSENSRDVALAEAEVTQQMYEEICESNSALEASLAGKDNELTELQRDHVNEVKNLTDDLHSAQTEKSALEARLNDAIDRADRTDKELVDVREKLTSASVKLDHVTKERDELQSASTVQKDRTLEIERELAQSRDATGKAEQRAELLNWKNEEITRDRDNARKKLDVMTERALKAEAQLRTRNKKASS